MFRNASLDPAGTGSEAGLARVELGLPGVRVGVGAHVCAFHRSGKGADVLLPYVRAGLAAGDKSICLVDSAESQMLRALTGDVTGEEAGESAPTEIWTPSESYLRDGEFRLARMMSWWEERVGSAVESGGYGFVRSVGNMSWALDTKTEAHELVRYESELNRFLPRYPQAMLCLYDLDQFNGEVLIGILETHPLVLLAGMVMENPYYIEPDAILTVLGTPEAARFATSEAMRLIKLASAQSRLHAVLVLAMLMAECVEEDKIVQLGVTAVPALAPCHAVGLYVADEGWGIGPSTGLAPDVLAALTAQLTALAPHGGRVTIEGEPWAWALPLSSLGGRVGDLVVAAAMEPAEEELFVLRALARQIGVAIAQARLHQREAHANDELRDSMIELERTRAETQQARGVAESASRAKSDFIAAMSHELRTPLNAVLGFAQLLEMSDDRPASDQEQIRHIMLAGRHLEELTDQVLDIARMEGGHLELVTSPTSWSVVAGEAISLVVPLADERGISVEHVLPPGPDLFVLADPMRLRQVLFNLLSNAVKYNREGGTIVVAVGPAPGPAGEGMVRVRVHDTGSGIGADQLHRLFVPFDRLGAETTGTPGAGLGLALTKGLVESMGGAMGVETTVDVGSTFWFDLPVASEVVDRGDTDAVAEGADRARGRATVVVIDDNEANLDLLRRVLLLRPAVEVVFARDGAEGLARCAVDPPDLVLLDMHLPRIEGREVLRRLKADPMTAEVPVVVLSGVAEAETIRLTRADGADGYLTKPFDVRELLELIDRLLIRQAAMPRPTRGAVA